MQRKSKKLNYFLILILFGLLLILAWWFFFQAKQPGLNIKDTIFVISRGESISSVASRLEKKGFISDAVTFKYLAKIGGVDKKIRHGEYLVPHSLSTYEILELFHLGKGISHKFTIPEGFSVRQVLELIKNDENFVYDIDFIPKEGSLAPDTYFVTIGTSAKGFIRRVQATQSSIVHEIWNSKSELFTLATKEDLIILASLIEKETSLEAEKREIASVFLNRLATKMRLQSDATVLYSLTKGAVKLGRKLKISDYRFQSDYNTYLTHGLPPTAICNPGVKSLVAAANPKKTNFFYFVADGSGGHAFSENFDQHKLNIKKWRLINQ